MERGNIYNKVIIWGAGRALLKWKAVLPRVNYIVDKELQGRFFCGYKVFGPDRITQEKGRILILISSPKHEKNIRADIERIQTDAAIEVQLLKSQEEIYNGSYAQYGEDIIVAKLFESMGINRISYIDIGMPTPARGSNTYYFHCLGNAGLCAEPNPDVIDEIKKVRKNDIVINCGVGGKESEDVDLKYTRFVKNNDLNTFSEEAVAQRVREGFIIADTLNIPMMSLDNLIEKYLAGKSPDFVSIDAEYYEIEIMKGFNFKKYDVKIFCIEKYDIITELMMKNGYVVAAQTPCNYIFMKENLYNDYCINWASHVIKE